MRERPILFSGPMVRAILEGQKTQTRRIITDRNSEGNVKPSQCDMARAFADHGFPDKDGAYRNHYLHAPVVRDHRGNTHDEDGVCVADVGIIERIYSRWNAGDRLWVRESFAGPDHIGNGDQGVVGFGIEYKADGAFRAHGDCGCEGPCGGVLIVHPWKPSIHMPREFLRITLQITGVRVERLQAITNADAIAEGCVGGSRVEGYSEANPADPYEEYAVLWDSLNAKRGYGWNVNPWVWVLEFKRADEQRAAT